MSFADRLRVLIGADSVSAFARRVELGESLIRKYLKGSEPTLSRAQQIAELTGCSLEWLASGRGSPDNPTDAIDLVAMKAAIRIMRQEAGLEEEEAPEDDGLIRTVAVYQYLRANRLRNGEPDMQLGRAFARFLRNEEHLKAFRNERVR
ncbi:helix-turn-helix domain-containing protein [Saccharospirillum mangrovi]|uniref:helix-turn-helix domain-containing protein n=1 Tax=Saccharospirillum mangrovi TaxID=2161747 RepID=UPI000D39B10F|nr:helix-turn-helix transcriptional regulator [Saccharospirillum mangrovi]